MNRAKYEDWNKERLINRINSLEQKLKSYSKFGSPVNVADSVKTLFEFEQFENYNYSDAVYDDILNKIQNYNDLYPCFFSNRNKLADELYDKLIDNPEVTGDCNYWGDDWRAAQALCHNYELLGEIDRKEAGINIGDYGRNDTEIRRYLLHDTIIDVLKEIYDDAQYDHPEAKECYEIFLRDNEDCDESDFYPYFYGKYKNEQDACLSLCITKKELENEYSIRKLENNYIYLIKLLE